MTRCRGYEFLGIAHGHLHRTPSLPRQFKAQGDVHGRALTTKVSAHSRGMKNKVLNGNPERSAQLLTQPVGRLVTRPDVDGAVGRHRHCARVRFQVAVVLGLRLEGMLKDPI